MKILILGGTGAMGTALVQILAKNQRYQVFVTSRCPQISEYENVSYLRGDAHDEIFLKSILAEPYDAIIDFMVYASNEFKRRVNLLLDSTGQYFFLSSGRVYADSILPITEKSGRLLDVCNDEKYLKTDEYALAKARGENILTLGRQNNWTIIRPYITYSERRLQLGVLEKEQWLRRALEGKPVVFSKDISEHVTSMTYGHDVAHGIAMLIGNERAYGEIFHIVGSDSMTWGEVLQLYQNVIEETTGKRFQVYMMSDARLMWEMLDNEYQIRYDRLYDRRFDSSKVQIACEQKLVFMPMREGLRKCLIEFIQSHQYEEMLINPRSEAWMDRMTKERRPLWSIAGRRSKVMYAGWRYVPHAVKIVRNIL